MKVIKTNNNARQKLWEMATIGHIKNYKIIVWSNDRGNIPHFHIIDSNTGGEDFNSCIKFLAPEYFFHEGKEGTLNTQERKQLVAFLQEENSDFPSMSNWEVAVRMWNINNSDKKLDPQITMPNYRLLKE